jgi:hypothetical protein
MLDQGLLVSPGWLARSRLTSRASRRLCRARRERAAFVTSASGPRRDAAVVIPYWFLCVQGAAK